MLERRQPDKTATVRGDADPFVPLSMAFCKVCCGSIKPLRKADSEQGSNVVIFTESVDVKLIHRRRITSDSVMLDDFPEEELAHLSAKNRYQKVLLLSSASMGFFTGFSILNVAHDSPASCA